jgi:aminoglycoside 6'-N-acetyltransferase
VDYAIGEPARVGRGVGTEVIAALVGVVRAARPGCGIVADPDARNPASRRVLEKNGFQLVAVKEMDSEPTDDPMAVYRLPAERGS